MPRKKKKKQQEEKLWDFELFFTDTTLVETDGKYNEVKKLMESDIPQVPIKSSKWAGLPLKNTLINTGVWTLRTRLCIVSHFGEGNLSLIFSNDRSVIITGFMPSVPDMYYNPDIRCLSAWSQQNGWKVPEPTEELIRSNMKFWKHMWETLLIDSAFLDQRYGMRKSLDMRQTEIEDDYEEEENGAEEDK